MAFTYQTIVAGSNFLPLVIEVKRDGVLLPSAGVTMTVSVKDKTTRLFIVEDAQANPVPETEGRWEYFFPTEIVDAISGSATWLIEWTLRFGPYTWRLPEPAQMQVRKRV